MAEIVPGIDRRQALATLGGSLLASAIAAQPARSTEAAAPALAMAMRPGQRLDGAWRYIIDPFDVAARKPRNRRAVWKGEVQQAAGPLIEYEWDHAPTMQIPGDWNSQVPELAFYDGPVFLEHRFAAPAAAAGRRQHLLFEAVNRTATVWLNGQLIARHSGGFTPFSVDVTGRLAASNRLVVRADSRHDSSSLPSVDFDWQNYGGITRAVHLIDTAETFIHQHSCTLQGERLKIAVTLDGPERATTAIKIGLGGRTYTVMPGADGIGRLELTCKLARWSPERPTLHPIKITAGADLLEDRIGLREVRTRGREILLNGRAIFLKGIAIHEERIGETPSRTVNAADARALLLEARALGCNFVRLAHYPHSEAMLRLADELGLLVWAEIPVYWEDIDYANPAVLAAARTMLAEMITRDANRASIILWSIANETPKTAERTAFLATLAADARRLDPSRLITAALDKNADIGGVKPGEARIRIDDPLADQLDVLAVNQYEAWYSDRTPADLANVNFEHAYGKPLIFSEFGADAKFGHHGPRSERWTEEYQAWLYEETLKLVIRTPGCVGLSPWLLKDFRSPRRWHMRFQAYWNRKGVIDERGRRKQAYAVLQRFYAGLKGQSPG